MLLNTGARMLCINENMQKQLQLPVLEKRKGQNADGDIEEYEAVGPIELKVKNRSSLRHAMALPGDNEPLPGAISQEDMDVLIHPQHQELIVNPEHSYFAQMKLK